MAVAWPTDSRAEFTKQIRLWSLTGGMANYPTEPAATCAGCQHRMAAVDRKPILFTDGLVDVTYMCDWCGTETKRALREPGRAGGARNGERRGLVA
jgi:hypothetical protein